MLGRFERRGHFSILKLHLTKTAAAPLLCPSNLEEAKSTLRTVAPLAAHVAVQDYAKRLGVLLGPGAGDKGWGAPILKHQARDLQRAG
eukprot:15476578-Alexandrium_andersonii.AAC.1